MKLLFFVATKSLTKNCRSIGAVEIPVQVPAGIFFIPYKKLPKDLSRLKRKVCVAFFIRIQFCVLIYFILFYFFAYFC